MHCDGSAPGRSGSSTLTTLGEVDLHLFNEGRHERLWEILGALTDDSGTNFRVWAPAAREVQVRGDFNGWDGSQTRMHRLAESGIWEARVPGLGSHESYKYHVRGADGVWRDKADPMAKWAQVPPETASRTFRSDFEWSDQPWLAKRANSTRADLAPMSIYEVHLGSWRRGLDYGQLAEQLPSYVAELGFTHVELLPVMEHPYGGSWGYQVTSYYAPTARFGDPDGLRRLIDAFHAAGIGVILDWVPAHFPKDDFALGRFDATPLYEDPNPARGEHPDWGTFVFNYGRREVRNFLVANALYWLEEFHIDGLRVDAVASMLYLDYSRLKGEWQPNVHGGRENLEAVQFLQELNGTVYKSAPGAIMIAEESTSWPGVTSQTDAGGLGFGFKWNMGWMHDTLHYLQRDPAYRSYHHNELTFSLAYAFSENYVLPISHDEVVHEKGSLLRKMPGDRWRQFANVRAYLAYMWAHPGKQLLFMGTEFAQDNEWAEAGDLDWHLLDQPLHRGVQQLIRDLNGVYKQSPQLWSMDPLEAGFEWLEGGDAARNTIAFIRWSNDQDPLVCVTNFSAIPQEDYHLGLPRPGQWQELINTDAAVYGGSGVGNLGTITAHQIPHHAQPASTRLRVPPLGSLWLRPRSPE